MSKQRGGCKKVYRDGKLMAVLCYKRPPLPPEEAALPENQPEDRCKTFVPEMKALLKKLEEKQAKVAAVKAAMDRLPSSNLTDPSEQN